MSTPFLGEIKMVAEDFAPEGWALCNGQILAISQYDALFALIGTTYGGNGTTTFALPNLQSRVPLAAGTGAALSTYTLGQDGGQTAVQLTVAELPEHNHTLNAVSGAASSGSPAGNLLADPNYGAVYASSGTAASMATQAIGSSGGEATAHNNEQPYLTINFIISLTGIFPSQD
jgi:microcystin-dependent protein